MVVRATPELLMVEIIAAGDSNNNTGISHAERGVQNINRQMARHKSKMIS